MASLPSSLSKILPIRRQSRESAPILSHADQILTIVQGIAHAPHICGPATLAKTHRSFTDSLKTGKIPTAEQAAANIKFQAECRRCYKTAIETVFDSARSYEESFNAFVTAEVVKKILGNDYHFPRIEIKSKEGVSIIEPVLTKESNDFVLTALSLKLAQRMTYEYGANAYRFLPNDNTSKRKLSRKSFAPNPQPSITDQFIDRVIEINTAAASKIELKLINAELHTAIFGSQIRLPKTLRTLSEQSLAHRARHLIS